MTLNRIVGLLAWLAGSSAAMAQPTATGGYLLNATNPALQAPSSMLLWCDSTLPILAQACTPRVASQAYPLPVAIVGGGGSSGGGSSTSTYATAPGVIATGGVAVVALVAGSIAHGFDLVNPAAATEPLYFTVGGTATIAAGQPSLQPGAAYHGPFGTAQALSVNAATAGHVFTLIGY